MTLLGQSGPVPERYAPEILQPISRAEGRSDLGLALPMHGEDVWHAWELGWLGTGGCPRVAVGRFVFSARSPNIVESKSFKLYLNSLNHTLFESDTALQQTLVADLSGVAGGAVSVAIFEPESPALAPTPMPGACIDGEAMEDVAEEPSAGQLRVSAATGEQQVLHSHALRSLCPVTAQPDWATVIVRCAGARVAPASLLAYLASFRRHQEFHEQCVERMFRDLAVARLEDFSVQALYTRRGGLDISPWRSTGPGPVPALRSMRQ